MIAVEHYNKANIKSMVFSCQDYPFTSKSGVKTELVTRADYERNFLEAINSGTSSMMQGMKYLSATSLLTPISKTGGSKTHSRTSLTLISALLCPT